MIRSKTALITGASAGIGYELSKVNAKNGYNLVLVSRNKQKLESCRRRNGKAMSKRTLKRHLSQESSSYQEILKTTRKELAQHYLSRSEISQCEIGYLLGFQDGNSFLCSFKGWTGTIPGDYRSEHLGVVLMH